jgi:hypothetical protein
MVAQARPLIEGLAESTDGRSPAIEPQFQGVWNVTRAKDRSHVCYGHIPQGMTGLRNTGMGIALETPGSCHDRRTLDSIVGGCHDSAPCQQAGEDS